MLVKFSCGCVGLVGIPGGKEGRDAVVLMPCDLPIDSCDESICVFRRDLSDKTHEPLGADEAAKLFSQIGHLVADGYRFRQVLWLLRQS